MTIILGIDPGSQKTGFGLISIEGRRHRYVSSGVIRLPQGALPERLKIIYRSLSTIIDEYRPDEAAVEDVFMSKSAGSAPTLGQAPGADRERVRRGTGVWVRWGSGWGRGGRI